METSSTNMIAPGLVDSPLKLLECVATCYDDPLRRDDVYAQVRAADRERQFRDCVAADELWQMQVG
jgi:hypothetical protein